MKGNVARVVAGRMCGDRNKMICGTKKEVDGVGGDGDVEEFYLDRVFCRKWRS